MNRSLSKTRRFVPVLESLDQRLVPAVWDISTVNISNVQLEVLEPTTPSVKVANGDIHIQGTSGHDHAELRLVNGKYQVTINSSNDSGFVGTFTFNPSQVTGGDVFFKGFGGNDFFRESDANLPVAKALRVFAEGGAGNDTLIGAWKNDTLEGGAGNDSINGGHGHDVLRGQDGDDIIQGWVGNDAIAGGDGADSLYGGTGNDLITLGSDTRPNRAEGGAGNDTMIGGPGNDVLHGNDGNDNLDGQPGADLLYGGAGNDSIQAGSGGDFNYLDGESGNDTLKGGDGGDEMYGGSGRDLMFGYGGADIINGGDGRDSLYGGDGDDDLNGGGDDNDYDRQFGGRGKDAFHTEADVNEHWYDVLLIDGYDPRVVEAIDFDSAEGDTID